MEGGEGGGEGVGGGGGETQRERKTETECFLTVKKSEYPFEISVETRTPFHF